MEDPVLNPLLKSIFEVQREVVEKLKNTHVGKERFATQRLRTIYANLEAAIERLEKKGRLTADALKEHSTIVAPMAARNIRREWEQLSKIFEGTAQPIAIDEAVFFARGNKILWPQFEKSAEKYAGRVGDRLRQVFMQSRLQSEGISQTRDRLLKEMPRVFKDQAWDAERLVRTEVLNSYGEYTRQIIQEAHADDKDIVRRWDATTDVRVCPFCRALDGQTAPVGGFFSAVWHTSSKKGVRVHSARVRGTPGHPCCRCFESVWKSSWGSVTAFDKEQSHGAR